MNLLSRYGLEEDKKPKEGEINVQDAEKPKDGFDGNIGDDVETADPATAQLSAASDDDKGTKTTDDGHQTVTVSKEDDDEGDDTYEGEPVGHEGDTDDSDKEATAEVKPEVDGDDNGTVEEPDDDVVKVEQDPKDVDVLPEDAAGKNTTVSNEERLRDAHQAAETLSRYAVAVEGFLTIARNALDENEGLNRETAQAIKLGVESFDVSFSNDQVVPGLENFGEVASRESTTIKVIKRLEDCHSSITQARDHAREIIDKL